MQELLWLRTSKTFKTQNHHVAPPTLSFIHADAACENRQIPLFAKKKKEEERFSLFPLLSSSHFPYCPSTTGLVARCEPGRPTIWRHLISLRFFFFLFFTHNATERAQPACGKEKQKGGRKVQPWRGGWGGGRVGGGEKETGRSSLRRSRKKTGKQEVEVRRRRRSFTCDQQKLQQLLQCSSGS